MISIPQVSSLPRLLVIGSGPAGVSTAIRLRDHGHEVLLVDRAKFPRDKLCGCCLNLAAIGALAEIDCDNIVTEIAPLTLQKWQMRLGRQRVESSLPGGIAVSRYAMDFALVNEAMRRGVEYRSMCDAKIATVGDHAVEVIMRKAGSGEIRQSFDAVVLATGLQGGGVSQWLPFVEPPRGPIGVGTVLEADCPLMGEIESRTIHMMCGPEGYVGLVRLEDGRVDVACAIRRTISGDEPEVNRQTIASRVDQILTSVGLSPFALAAKDTLRMTPPLTRRRVVGQGALVAVGDAARYVEPFTGEGMAWAIESGIAAADCISEHFRELSVRGLGSGQTVGKEWKSSYAALLKRRHWICRGLSIALRSERFSNCMVPAMKLAPWLTRWTIGQLNRSRQ